MLSHEFDNYKPHTLAEENKLARSKDPEAKVTLALHNMREALKYSKRCSRYSIPEDVLVSLCYMALSQAAKSFAPNRVKFFAFAKVFLRGVIHKHFSSLRVVRKGEVTCRENLEEAIAVARIKKKGDHEEEEDVELHTGEYTDPNFRLIELREKWSMVAPLLTDEAGILNPHEQMILKLTYESAFTFKKIADSLGISTAAVQAVHSGALRKIRSKLLDKHLLIEHY